MNAAIAPVVGRYTQRLQQDLGPGRLRIMRSSLGVLPAAEAAQFPARAMFSGPAGGVLATAQLARAMRMPRAAAFDMGGTSADVCLVEDGTAVHEAGTIAGLPLALPSVPVHTVGCGGGSIAYVDGGGALRVGPESAGADPGPACYGKGREPTVTDAHVALGHLGSHTLLGGGFPIDVDAAVRAIERLAKRLGMSPLATARGILTVADATMARAVLVITAERAVDPADVPLVAYGGAGGLHAAGLVARLGMPAALIPDAPGAFSALGLALAGEASECSEAVHTTLDRRRAGALRALADTLRRRALQGIGGRARARVEAHVRYRGQGAALRLGFAADLATRFAREHQRRYGFTMTAALEVVRLTARAETAPHPIPPSAPAAATAEPHRRRAPLGGHAVRVVPREAVRGALRGPAVVEETTATTVVPAGWLARATPRALVLARAAR